MKEKLTKDSGVAGSGAYDHIVEKLRAKPNATGEEEEDSGGFSWWESLLAKSCIAVGRRNGNYLNLRRGMPACAFKLPI